MLVNSKKKSKLISKLIKLFFRVEAHFLRLRRHNYPNEPQCIFALWHAHQFAIYDIYPAHKVNIIVSKSHDGDFIAEAAEFMGFKTVRGSTGKKGAVESTLTLLNRLKEGDSAAITVDGPRGPKQKVKKGVIKIAKNSGLPIIPMIWYSEDKSMKKIPSWDEFTLPLLYCRAIVVYGDPIFISPDNTDEQDEEARLVLEQKLLDLYEQAPRLHEEAFSRNILKNRARLEKQP